MKTLKILAPLMVAVIISACGAPRYSSTERYIATVNAKTQADNCYREATRNPSVQKIDREVIPDPTVLSPSQIKVIKNTDKKITPEQRKALLTYHQLLRRCDEAMIDGLIDAQQKRIVSSRVQSVEMDRVLLINGEITIKEFNRRNDLAIASGSNYQNSTPAALPNSQVNWNIPIPPSNNNQIRNNPQGYGDSPPAYQNRNTQPWIQAPQQQMNCFPNGMGGVVCQ